MRCFERTLLLAVLSGCGPSASLPELPGLPVQIVGSTVAGVEDLVCRGPGALRWERDGVVVAEGAGELRVAARETVPGRWACSAPDGSASAAELALAPHGGNVVVILLDDVGIDKVGLYGVPVDTPPTPTIDRLAAEGVRFSQAWALPECVPTRASLLTGRYPRRTGLGSVFLAHSTDMLALEEVTIPELLRASPLGYRSALAGKWHLSPLDPELVDNPAAQGFERHAGSINNLQTQFPSEEPNPSLGYYLWEKDSDGVLSMSTTYATTDTTDDAVAAMAQLPEPWFLYVPYNAAHMPWHVPPRSLYTGPEPVTDIEMFHASIEAADTEIGRLIDSMSPELRERTTILLLSDNGTPSEVLDPAISPLQSKGRWLEGSTRVPMIASGPLVAEPGSVCDAYVNVVDVLPTVAAIAGAPTDDGVPRDGSSLLPYLRDPGYPSAREVLWSEKFTPNGAGPYEAEFHVVRNATHIFARGFGVELLHRRGPGELDATDDLLSSGEPLGEDDARALAVLREAMEAQEQALGIELP